MKRIIDRIPVFFLAFILLLLLLLILMAVQPHLNADHCRTTWYGKAYFVTVCPTATFSTK